jgi:hypothetical protein
MAEGVPAKTLAVLLDMNDRVVRRLAAEGIIVRAGRNQYLLRRRSATMSGTCGKSRPAGKVTS